LPIALLGLVFYLVFLVLVVLDHRQRPNIKTDRKATPVARLLVGLAAMATVYSLALFGYSLAKGSICQFCAVLYVVNTGLLVATFLTLGESFGSFMRGVWSAIPTRPAAVAAVLMVTFTAGGYFMYRSAVVSARAANEARRIQNAPTGDGQKDRPTKGPADAQVKFIEFADFECPHCKIAFRTLDALVKDRPDVSVTFLHFPLDMACNPLVDRPFHERACEFAVLAECAHRQGVFWQTAEMLFDADEVARDELLMRVLAFDPKVDRTKLEACLTSEDALAAVKQDVAQGIKTEIRGTPSVFLNGKQIGGAVPRPELDRLISEILGNAN